MRVDFSSVPQSQIESTQVIDKKENKSSKTSVEDPPEDLHAYVPYSLGLGRTYSLSSLRAAVDYHAKFLTVAESNLAAAGHGGVIPQAILESLR